MNNYIEIDVSDWYVEKWINAEWLYAKCYEYLSDIPDKTSGVYYIFDCDELLYIGTSVNLKGRLVDHLLVNSNTKEFIRRATRVECVLIADKDKRCIFEYTEIVNREPSKNKVLPRLSSNQNKVIEFLRKETLE